MALHRFAHKSFFPIPVQKVYEWHTKPGAFLRLSPPWVKLSLLSRHPGVTESAQIAFRTWIGFFYANWEVKHQNIQPGVQFEDVMLAGPFSSWKHSHIFNDLPNGTELEDIINYRLKFDSITDPFFHKFTERVIKRTFKYRSKLLRRDLSIPWLNEFPKRSLKILITGGTGFIGSALATFLQTQGHDVTILSRGNPHNLNINKTIVWNHVREKAPLIKLEGFDAIINLTGESVVQRWTEEVKNTIWDSRVNFTKSLVEAISQLSNPPKIYIGASGIGYYGGHQLEGEFTETSPKGHGFLPDLSEAWEHAAHGLRDMGIRTVFVRAPIVLSPEGGAFQKIILNQKLCLGGSFGPPNNNMPWIARDDLLDIILFSLLNEKAEGPLNAVAPGEVTNREFASMLGMALDCNIRLKIPDIVLKLLFGEMGEEIFFSNIRISQQKLFELGYQFRFPTFPMYLKELYLR